jgi:hypothetical protein
MPRRSTIRIGTTLENINMNDLFKLHQQIAEMEKQATLLQKQSRPVDADQWDGRPHPKRHECAKVEVLINHLNRKGRLP